MTNILIQTQKEGLSIMSDPRKPLITSITNDANNRNFNVLPTAYAVNQLFSGEYIEENTDVDSLIKCGNYRFSDTTTGLPSHMEGKTGIITVLHDRVEVTEGRFGVNDPSTTAPTVIRQIAWPDGPGDITPYTRTKVNGVWGDWVIISGNIRRVKLIGNITAETNVMYYSFGNYTLTLPDPDDFILGTWIGLEQYSGTGTVKWNVSLESTLTQITTPAYVADDRGAPTTDIIGPNVYYFEIVEDNNGNRQWILDVDNDISNTITDIRRSISNEILNRNAAIADAIAEERDARIAADGDERDARSRADRDEAMQRSEADNEEAVARANGDMNTLTLARTYTDNIVETAIETERNARYNADTALSDRINTNSSAISGEAVLRYNADTALSTRINTNSSAIETERDARSRADNEEIAERKAGDSNTLTSAETYTDNIAANKDKLHKVFFVTATAIKTSVPNEGESGYNVIYCFTDGNNAHVNINELLKVIHPTFVLSRGCTKVYIPVAEKIYLGSKLTIEIWGDNQSVTVYESNNPNITNNNYVLLTSNNLKDYIGRCHPVSSSINGDYTTRLIVGGDVGKYVNELVTSELFTNNTGENNDLILPFECVYDKVDSKYAWKLLCLQ